MFYALTDRAATHGVMEAVIVTPAQLRALVAADDEDNPSEDLRIVSPTEQGFVLARVFSEAPSLYPSAQGQALLAAAIEPMLARLLGDQPRPPSGPWDTAPEPGNNKQ